MTTAASTKSSTVQWRRTLGLFQLLLTAAWFVTIIWSYLASADAGPSSRIFMAAAFVTWAISWLAWPDQSGLSSRFSTRVGSILMLAVAASLFAEFLHSV
jgi:hypothetical protein